MKKTYKAWLQDFIWELLGVRLPILTAVIFAVIAARYWPEYALISSAVYLVVAFIVSDFLLKKKK